MFRKVYKFTFSVLILIWVFPSVYSQGIWYSADSTIYKGDSVILHIEGFRGDIQWLKSFDLDVWDSIPGAIYDSLKMVADTSAYFRAKVTEGTCNPIFSDTIQLNVVNLNTKSILIDNVGASLLSDSTEQAQGTYKYEFGDSIPELEPGNVLVSGSGQGYMRKITNVTLSGDQYIVETEQARLVDVIDECNIKDSIKLTINNLKSAYVNGIPIPAQIIYLEKGVTLKSKGSGLDLTNMVLFSGVVEYENEYGVQLEANLNITITNGEVSFEPMFERNLNISLLPPGVKYLKLTAGGNLDFDLDMEVVCDASVTYSADKTIAKVLFGPIPLGPVPMFIELSFKVGFETGLDINGSVTAGFESDFALEFGAEYDRNEMPKWNSIWNKNSQFTVHEPVWDANANFGTKLYVAPQLAATIASVAGPYMSVNPYLRFDAGIEIPDWNWELAGGIDGYLGFKVSLFSYEIADWNTQLANWETTLASNSGTFTEYPPIVETSEATDISEASATVGGNVSDNGGVTVTERGVYYSTFANPETTGTKLTIGSGIGSFSTGLTNLSASTTYYIKAYAINSKGEALGDQVSFTTISGSGGETGNFTDARDSHEYQWVKIGEQIWMAENLAYLPVVSPSSSESATMPIYYVYGYEGTNVSSAKATDNYQTYGVLYNWAAAMLACPDGWHLPSDDEWKQLEIYLGMAQNEANEINWRGIDVAPKLKSTNGWYDNGNGTNESGFNAIPGGLRSLYGTFISVGTITGCWSSTKYSNNQAWRRTMDNINSGVHRFYSYLGEHGWTVRCIKD